MTSLDFIDKEIEKLEQCLMVVKANGALKYKLKYFKQIKTELEAWEVINNHFEYFEMEEGDVFVNKQELFAQTSPFDNNDLKIIKKVVVMKND